MTLKYFFSDHLGWVRAGDTARKKSNSDILKALEYATGPICYVMEGKRYTGCVDAENILRKFARDCALDVIHLWNAPPIVRKYLETGDESIREAARDAARDIVRDDTSDVAGYAAWCAAGDALWEGAWTAAKTAAWAAARSAAGSTAWNAVRDEILNKYSLKLEALIQAKLKVLQKEEAKHDAIYPRIQAGH
jgi:hypothetical protein